MTPAAAPAFFIAGGVVLVWWAIHRRRALALLPDDWVRVTGVVVEVGRAQRVEYLVADGRRLRLQVPTGTTVPVGGDVVVLHDPRDPSRARLAEDDRVAAGLVRLLLMLGVASLVLGAVTAVAFG